MQGKQDRAEARVLTRQTPPHRLERAWADALRALLGVPLEPQTGTRQPRSAGICGRPRSRRAGPDGVAPDHRDPPVAPDPRLGLGGHEPLVPRISSGSRHFLGEEAAWY